MQVEGNNNFIANGVLVHNCGIIDDPYETDQDAHSWQYNETLWGWYDATFSLRAEPNASIIIAMARWTDWDFCARVLKNEPGRWTVLKFPAIAEENDPAGRKPGEALFPERWPVDQLQKIMETRGRSTWAARLQQAPELATDRLYAHFNTLANEDDKAAPQRTLPLAVCFDFNISPGMHAELFQYDEKADMFAVFAEFHAPRMDVGEACAAIKAWLAENKWVPTHQHPLEIFGDASGSSQWAGTGDSCFDILQRALGAIPHRVRRPASNPPVIDRINTVNEALCDGEKRVHIKIHSRCERLLDDLRSMKPDAQGLENKEDTKLSHASSALGYAVCYLRPLWQGGQKQIGGRAG